MWLPLTAILIAGIFIIDLWTPRGWAVWILYVIPLFLYARLSSNRRLISLAAVCSVLTMAGFLFSPPGVSLMLSGANRVVGMSVLGLATALLVRNRRAEEALRVAHDTLEWRVAERTEARQANAALQAQIQDRRDAEKVVCESEERFRGMADTVPDVIFTARPGGSCDYVNSRFKRAEEQLREHERHMRLFILATNDIIWNRDLTTDVVTSSIGFKKAFGYSVDDVAPTLEWWKERIHPDDLLPVLEKVDAALYGGNATCAYEYRFRRRDGSYAAISERMHIMRDHAGTAVRALGAMTDITERKRAEEALRKSDEQLQKVVAEREQLAQDLHDNIIQSVYAIGLGLEECQQLIPEDAAAAVAKLGRAISDLNVVIRDIRNYIIGDEPALIVSAKQFRAELARLVQTMQGVQFPRFRVSLETIATSQLTPEEARHVLFIAREAMSNSLRHSGAKTGAVSFRRNNGSLSLQVEDDGLGFDVQTESDGCGLRNMRARAQKLGAQLNVVSSRGRGTRIIVDIPREDPLHST